MSAETNNLIAFPGVRLEAEPATLIISAVLAEEPLTVKRQFGVNDQLTMAELGRVLCVLFGWKGEAAPTRFTLRGLQEPELLGARGTTLPTNMPAMNVTVPADAKIAEVLQEPGDKVAWYWGLWEHRLQVREAFARDEATPDALCIGGSGNIASLWRNVPYDEYVGGGLIEPNYIERSDAEVDIAAINQELTGEESIQETLAAARPDVADVIERSGVYEFVPLLQALDLQRETGGGGAPGAEIPEPMEWMRALPAECSEEDPAGHDAAIVTLLCLAAMTTEEVRWDVSEHVMESLGWVADDGTPLSGADIDGLCPATWEVLEACNLFEISPVERLDLLREALRR